MNYTNFRFLTIEPTIYHVSKFFEILNIIYLWNFTHNFQFKIEPSLFPLDLLAGIKIKWFNAK